MQFVRITFKKLDSLKYISHLDLNRLFTRMIKRSKLDIWYSEGFSPHPYLVFSPPLSVGFSSLCEIVDIKLNTNVTEIEIVNSLNKAAPSGIVILSAKEPVNKIHKIEFAMFKITINTTTTLNELENLKKSDTIIVMKRSKSREIPFDIKPYFKDIVFTKNGDEINFEVILPASPDLTLKASLITSVIKNITYTSIERIKFLDNQMNEFK